jgi:nitroimidazol reductase NimA-like FMN-containing flavoprotein (pyridoxamine 5'-phosphate oxidase superfamily)
MRTARSDRIRLRRSPKKARYDHAGIVAILDRALVGHVPFVEQGQPLCIPMLCAHVNGWIYIHGSHASRALRVLARGEPACVTATLVDGLVLARSIYEHTANYESVIAFGRFSLVDNSTEKLAALEAFAEKLLPGRWSEVREPSPRELQATTVLAFEIEEASAKVRAGPPDDDGSADAALDVWAGELPIVTAFGTPIASPGLRNQIPLAESIRRLVKGSSTTQR